MYCTVHLVLGFIVTNKCTINIVQVYITTMFPGIIDTPTFFNILCHHQGVIYMLLAKNLCNLARSIYTECPRRNVPDFGKMFLKLKYTDITQNTYIQS